MIAPEDVRNLSEAEFGSFSDEKIQLFIDIAGKQISEPAWPDAATFDQAHKLLTAHYLAMSGRSGASGPISSIKVGEVSVAYGAPQNKEKLSLSSWGQLFLGLVDANIVSAMLV